MSVRKSIIPKLPRRAWTILAGDAFSALGNGLVLPFLIVYLHRVRGIDLAVSGFALALVAAVGIMGSPITGTLIDKIGARGALIISLIIQAVGAVGYALTTRTWHAMVASAVFGLGIASFWPAIQSLLSTIVPDHQRSAVFSVHYASLNAGLGIGGITGGLIADISSPGSFETLYLVDAATYLVFIAVLIAIPAAGRSSVEAEVPTTASGYRSVFRDRNFVRIFLLNALLVTIGYAQLESVFPAFATGRGGVGTSVVGAAFAANTAVIVLSQLFVLRHIDGWQRTSAIRLMSVLWAIAWGLVYVVGTMGGTVAAVGFIFALGIFGLGETFMSPTIPAMVNDLSPDHLRGRYNALHTLSWRVGDMVGPAMAGVMLGRGLGGPLFAILVAGCGLAMILTSRLARTVPGHANVILGEAEPVDAEAVA